ncbi:unnamed protein product [Somion occarium]|uniref:methylated diphthine methylhydrolase n=1 Tax=Somion occarium TaxID=3059160 RepID=A0ABP1CMB3_9APHY
MKVVPAIFKLDTIDPADSVEFCPHPAASNVVVCGTYKLQQADPECSVDIQDVQEEPFSVGQKRTGKCLAFEVANGDQLNQIQEISLPAVPDMKWCHRDVSVNPVLGIADSEGNVSLYEMKIDDSLRIAPSHVLCLSLDWSNRRTPSSGLGSLVVSLSDGSLALLVPGQSGLSPEHIWHAHDFEPWIAAWNYWDINIIYSGGDDLKMKAWDIRSGFTQPVFTNKRFDAGVTTIQSHPFVEHLLAVGSYDNTVRLFDARKPLTPLTQVDVGGGAWRVKWHPSKKRKDDLLVACMHNGCKVIHFNLTGNGLAEGGEVIQHFDKHKSMAYGADWSYTEENTNQETLVASCSFYDHVLYTWRA